MGFDIYEGVPLEVGDCDGAAYSLGDQTSIADGVYVAKEGIVVIDDGKVVAFFDHLKDTKGRKIEPCNCTSFEGYIEQIVKDGEEWRKAE